MPQSDVPFLRTFYVLSGLNILGPLAFKTFLPALEDAAKYLNTGSEYVANNNFNDASGDG